MVDRLGHDIGCLFTALMWAVVVLAVAVVALVALIVTGVL
jgi:hypothetical protein